MVDGRALDPVDEISGRLLVLEGAITTLVSLPLGEGRLAVSASENRDGCPSSVVVSPELPVLVPGCFDDIV